MSIKATTLRVNVFESKDSVIMLSSKLIREFDINLQEPLILRFGSSKISTNVIQIKSKKLSEQLKLHISKKVQKVMGIPQDIKLNIRPIAKQKVQLGPVIGMLIPNRIYENNHFGFYLNYYAMLKSGLMYIFAGQGVNPKTKTIQGSYFDPAKKAWSQAEFPYPDVVIDRCYPNGRWTHTQLEKVIGKGRIFNKTTMITKAGFYNTLINNKYLRNYLPESRIYTKVSDLKDFLKKHHKIFLKPLSGMQGRGIIRVSSKNHKVIGKYIESKDVVEKKLSDSNEVISLLKQFGYPGRRKYIMQQAVPRMKYQGKPFCFRVMVCKNGNGQWLVPAIFTNTATGKSFLTNHAAGAKFITLKQLFSEIEGQLACKKNDFINLLVEIGVKTAEALDEKYGPLGELGLDMVVDRSGKPWLLEANGNPGMVPRSHMVEFPQWVYQAFNLPISYAIYLSGLSVPAMK